MKKGILSVLEALVYPLVYLGSQVVASLAAAIAYVLSGTLGGDMQGVSLDDISTIQSEFVSKFSQQILIAGCVMSCIIAVIIIRARGQKVKDTLIIKRIPLNSTLLVVAIGISVNIATVFALSIIPIPQTILDQYNKLIGESIVTDNFWLTFFTTALLVPLTEEIIFRGMSFNALRRSMRLTLAIVIQTLIFACAHMLPLQVAYVMPASLVLGLVYVWCDSIVAPVLLHVAYNGLSAVLSAVPIPEGDATSPESDVLPFIIMVAALLLASVCLMRLYRVYKERIRAEQDSELQVFNSRMGEDIH